MNSADWIAVDWGTSNLRAWLMDRDDRVVDTRLSDRGMQRLAPDEFGPALHALIGAFDGMVIACGMVGSRQGWTEAPYVAAPCAPPGMADAARVGMVHILPGIKQMAPPDVMRGEETQIKGVLAEQPDFDGVICLPGTHTKWVHISAGEVVSFRTAMTGEMFGLLREQSILRHSVDTGWNQPAFHEAISDAMTRPEKLAAALFQIRAAALLSQLEPGVAQARLSGLLIGAELASMRAYWLGQSVAIVGEAGLAARYADALSLQGVGARVLDSTAMTLGGLIAAKAELATT